MVKASRMFTALQEGRDASANPIRPRWNFGANLTNDQERERRPRPKFTFLYSCPLNRQENIRCFLCGDFEAPRFYVKKQNKKTNPLKSRFALEALRKRIPASGKEHLEKWRPI